MKNPMKISAIASTTLSIATARYAPAVISLINQIIKPNQRALSRQDRVTTSLHVMTQEWLVFLEELPSKTLLRQIIKG
jgi:hypothetical protein